MDDKRLQYVKDRVVLSFPKIGTKLDKTFANEEFQEKLAKFFDFYDNRCLVVDGGLKIETSLPRKMAKGKVVLFMKVPGEDEVTVDNISNTIVAVEVGGVSNTVFEHLELLSNEIMLPVLSNPNNQQKWGEVSTREILDRFFSFLSSTTILCGQIKGETRLPMPPIEISSTAGSIPGKNRISLLEGAIITWSKQIKNVLKQDPESQLKMGSHPTPDAEIEFWKSKAVNLNSIVEQLKGKKIVRMLNILNQAKSTYCTTFARLCRDVATARQEANDNTKYLRTLEEWFNKLNSEADFPNLQDLFKPILHIILLIWKNSKHYNGPSRLVVLMREICNSLINQACNYVSGEQIFNLIEAEDAQLAVEKLQCTIRVCTSFKHTYSDYKTTANAECPANPWKLPNNALFMRLDSFLERCHDILDLTQTIVQFSKLAKIEVGGTKGKSLTQSVEQIYGDFLSAVNKFKKVSYDIMDVGAKLFDDDFYDFRCSIKELERRLAAVVSMAFDDCATVYGKFKLLDSFEGLLERPIIQDELEKKYVALVQAYGQDLRIVQEIFLAKRDRPPIPSNFPPIAGSLTWCRGLVERIQIPMQKLQQLDMAIQEREESKEVMKTYATIIGSLQEYENQKIEEWGRDVEASSQAKLKLSLLLRNPETRMLAVNFDPALERLLREVKYFLLLALQVPDGALEIYQQVEVFRKWRGNLDLIVNSNNSVLEQLIAEERPLVRPYLDRFDRAVDKGSTQLNWRSNGINEFIEESSVQIKEVDEVVRTMKNNLAHSVSVMKSWKGKPLMERKPKPVEAAEFMRTIKSVRESQYRLIKEGGKDIHNCLKDTNKILRVSNTSPDWVSYKDYVNSTVVSGLAEVVSVSLQYFLDQIDLDLIMKEEKLPMLEISMELVANDIKFIPDLGRAANGRGIGDIVDTLLGNFLNISTLFRRLDNAEGGTYLREMHADFQVRMLMSSIYEKLAETREKCEELRGSYDKFQHLWSPDPGREQLFAQFCDKSTTLVATAAALGADTDLVYLDLDKFDEAVSKYKNVRAEVEQLKGAEDIGWLRVSTRQVKASLILLTNQWITMFTNHLESVLVGRLTSLDTFIAHVTKGLEVKVEEGDAGKDSLMAVMKDIGEVRKARERTQRLFGPLGDTVQLLKKHNIDTNNVRVGDKSVQDYLEEAPMAWDALVNSTFKKKEEILPHQMAEVNSLKGRIESFTQRMVEFRMLFRQNAPFNYDGGPFEAYSMMEEHAQTLFKMETESKGLNELEDLFELQISKYSETADTRNELSVLKRMWDFKSHVLNLYMDWRTTLWSEIDTDGLQERNTHLAKGLRSLGNDYPMTKGWGVFRNTEKELKDMSTNLPLINELHSDAMRDRHWKQLARICHVKAINPSDPKFTFDDMMHLHLHEHVDDVQEIVDLARKELKTETKLGEIEGCWSGAKGFNLDYVPHKDTEMFVVKPSEEVMETLEAHQMDLQSMIGAGNEYFREKIELWQTQLSTVEEVLKVWVSVSKNWASLESIFLASADIRSQLPDDTKRFEEIDGEFKELMKEAILVPNVLDTCMVDARYEMLKSMMSRLELCQKSLNDYLETKKKIFPRFYFVSNSSLLDILANGTNPPKILPYLSDCFDALADLTFAKNEDGTTSDFVVNEMIAKDKERVMLHEEFTMIGEVEGYLNRLTEQMQTTLRHRLNDGIETAVNWEVETPRHKWLDHYPAQIVVTGTQIYWTEETEAALEELEAGQEDAMKRYLQTCNQRLTLLIERVLENLKKGDRVKIITLITLDVHARDVIQKLIDQKIDSSAAFLWQQQLRFYWIQSNMDVDIRITDFRTKYFYEWIGNTGRLVITPLTDRCYITLTMGLRLFKGGAPAGPAGTGKTETTKDLARALALPCYVFNCSDQMNYQTMADIFRGLAQTGGWGCFDEFNRIQIEVLSVVATQVKEVQDAVKRLSVRANRDPEYMDLPEGKPPVKVGLFDFQGDPISLIPTCGFYITMNPGYAGRTELPENLKALFRSCAMIRPDLQPICENMLMSEGFQSARLLAVKFVTLYQLSSELLSKQVHYDWGLRAVKSVLRVAGMLKRGEPNMEEAVVLMRALRDFNKPKIPQHDMPIFRRLIYDLFMGHDPPAKMDENLKKKIIRSAVETGLQTDEGFVLKTLQFQELLDVRHSVMLLGPAGCGKTTVWKTLAKAHNLDKTKKACVFETVNPKAVTGNELYGYMTLAKDWKDGVLSIIMRGMSKNYSEQGFHVNQTNKWVVLDGDIDAVWIESMNTVMDDNKVLTLVSNERIPLSDPMRMVFEISSLKNATPATVSRAGILYINETDIGWRPFVDSWIATRENAVEKAHLSGLFEKYIDPLLEMTRKDFKESTPLRLFNKVCTTLYLTEGLLDSIKDNKKTPEVIEQYFTYASAWAFGGGMAVDKSGDHRGYFSDRFSSVFTTKFPKEGQIFDYYYDLESDSYLPWADRVPTYDSVAIGTGVGETPFMDITVATADSVRMEFLLDLLVRKNRFVMFVGSAGTGKTNMVRQYLRNLKLDEPSPSQALFGGGSGAGDGGQAPANGGAASDAELLSYNISMNYYTDSAALQRELELPIEKRSGRRFGPAPTKRLIYFIDDLNLPQKEEYGTQNAIALLTQHIQYGTIFDRNDLGFRKEIVDVQYVTAMNPTAGSFEVDERCQRHFSTFTAAMPPVADLRTIYGSILTGHVTTLGFNDKVVDSVTRVVDASIALHAAVATRFLPSAVKFTYNWNMREHSKVFEGLCSARPEAYLDSLSLVRLWAHESVRVFGDRLFSEEESEVFMQMLADVSKKNFSEKPDDILEEPLLHANFIPKPAGGGGGVGEGTYCRIPNIERLKSVVEMRLEDYNETNPVMDLVLFEQATEHVTRISRIIRNPAGNAMLIGVGGTGKQSLARLASFICSYEVKSISVTSNYRVDDFRENLKDMFREAGGKGTEIVFLLTDSQIIDDRFLVFINDILASGWVSDLFAKDEIDQILGSNTFRNEAKASGVVVDSTDEMLDFLIARLKRNFHLVLAFSPVGESFRTRARRFPGLINSTAINVFRDWPEDALISVAERFLGDVFSTPEQQELKQQLAIHMSTEHLSVQSVSASYLETQRRYNYVTPKSYLELIGFYKFLLDQKQKDIHDQIDRLDVGLSRLNETEADVSVLKQDLELKMVDVEKSKAAADLLLEEMGRQRQDCEVQQGMALEEKKKADEASAMAAKIEMEAEKELAEAKPMMEAAKEAVNVLTKAALSELKAFPKLPDGVSLVTDSVLILVEKERNKRNFTWERAKKMMANIDQFKGRLENIKGSDLTEEEVALLTPYVSKPLFDPEKMRSKSHAAANLCSWVVNIYRFNRIYVKVKPLMDSLEEARAQKAEADKSLQAAAETAEAVNAKLTALEEKFMQAQEEKRIVEETADACMKRLQLAERLVGGLSSEKERWGQEIQKLRESEANLIGDCMVAAGFVSYVGAFDQANRNVLWRDVWIPDLTQRQIPITEGIDPLNVLATDAKKAKMVSEGLPADRISIENGSIITQCKRWPLLIDPQLQGIKWLRSREKDNGLTVTQLGQKDWLRHLERSIAEGMPLLLENLGQELDATLDPVLSRSVFKKGRNYYIKLGGEDIEFNPNFKLYLQTRLSNPHYKPEIAAQCTLINFIATEKGLEDQLLAKVVGKERPELEATAEEIQTAAQQYKIKLMELEDDLLERLANAPEDILSDVALIEGLENTKLASKEINEAMKKGEVTEMEINKARELYRAQASEGAMLYFMLTKLCMIEHMYQYSLDSFVTFFFKSIDRAEPAETEEQRVLNLRESLRMTIYTWVSRGLFERHKLIFLAQLTFELIRRRVIEATPPGGGGAAGASDEEEGVDDLQLQFLMRGPRKFDDEANQVPWLPDSAWQSCRALADLPEFEKFPADLVETPGRFREWFNHVTPEREKLPLDWAALDRQPFKKMLVVRCLRPDRISSALGDFIRMVLPNGGEYVDCDARLNNFEILGQSLADSTSRTPIYFVLSAGANVVGDLDRLAEKNGMEKNRSYHNVSMGQGQDVVAEAVLESAHRNGHWVILNNIHLMPRWLLKLEKTLDKFATEGSHKNFRLYLTSDPSKSIPIGILNRCIKLTNEPPAGLRANLKRAVSTFSKEEFDDADSKTKSILFGLCHFHSILVERMNYGPMGFNMRYPFSAGDLTDSALCLHNYMENTGGGRIPWQDLKYIFGEIMYGGHIVNDFDRLMANTYLDWFMKDLLLDEAELYPFAEDEKGVSFMSPSPTTLDKYIEHIDTMMTTETPIAFGLHPNAEIEVRTQQSERLFKTLLELQPRDAAGGEGVQSAQQVAETVAGDILGMVGDKKFDVDDVAKSLEDAAGPYQHVFMQEMDVFNVVLMEMVRSLQELQLGFAGELTMSDSMEALMDSLYLDRVPKTWGRSWPSMRSLTSWLANLAERLQQIEEWTNNPLDIPKVTWISGLVNPQSFLTAICQVTAQKQQLELDKLTTYSDVTKKMSVEEVEVGLKEGAYVHGMYLQGARWDPNSQSLEKSQPKEMFCVMPIVQVRAITKDKASGANTYMCPCYKTEMRGSPNYVFSAQLRTPRSPPARWILAGVALIMDVAN